MMYPHRIRLRGPWQAQIPAESHIENDHWKRVSLPCLAGDWAPPFPCELRLLRRFGYPGTIDPYENVWLTLENLQGTTTIKLNDKLLAGDFQGEKGEWLVTQFLQPRNELRIDIACNDAHCGLGGEVALEVRRHAYLTDVKVKLVDSIVAATGNIVGTNDRPMDLYLLLDNKTVCHETITTGSASDSVVPFRITSVGTEHDISHAKQAVVEMIDGSVVWYRVEVPLFKE